MLIVNVAPGLRVTGRETLDAENAVPLTATDVTFTACVPVDVRMIDCAAVVLTSTSPKLRLDVLAVNWPPD
jgi:hypothetical protein